MLSASSPPYGWGSSRTLLGMNMNSIILTGLVLIFFTACSPRKLWFDVEVIEEELSNAEDVDQGINPDEIKEYLISNYEIEGSWKFQNWHDGVDLEISKISENNYQIICKTWGDICPGWSLERTGNYENGVITLDQAIKTCSPGIPYKNFYSMNTPEGVRILTPSDIRTWILEKDDLDWGIILDFASLKNERDM